MHPKLLKKVLVDLLVGAIVLGAIYYWYLHRYDIQFSFDNSRVDRRSLHGILLGYLTRLFAGLVAAKLGVLGVTLVRQLAPIVARLRIGEHPHEHVELSHKYLEGASIENPHFYAIIGSGDDE